MTLGVRIASRIYLQGDRHKIANNRGLLIRVARIRLRASPRYTVHNVRSLRSFSLSLFPCRRNFIVLIIFGV